MSFEDLIKKAGEHAKQTNSKKSNAIPYRVAFITFKYPQTNQEDYEYNVP